CTRRSLWRWLRLTDVYRGNSRWFGGLSRSWTRCISERRGKSRLFDLWCRSWSRCFCGRRDRSRRGNVDANCNKTPLALDSDKLEVEVNLHWDGRKEPSHSHDSVCVQLWQDAELWIKHGDS